MWYNRDLLGTLVVFQERQLQEIGLSVQQVKQFTIFWLLGLFIEVAQKEIMLYSYAKSFF